MPNWCFTKIYIEHQDSTKLNELYNFLREWTSKNYMENGFGTNWLGNIVLGSGIGTVDTDKATDLSCRGTLDWYEVQDGELVIDTETAWSPMLKMWIKLIDKYLPGAKLFYTAEEEMNGVQCTNYPDLLGRYVIDYYGNEDIESDWEASEDSVREILQKLLDTEETNINKLIEMAWDEDAEVSIRKWEWADLDEVASWE